MDIKEIPKLIGQKMRIKSNIQARNYLVGEIRRVVSVINNSDTKRMMSLQNKINELKNENGDKK